MKSVSSRNICAPSKAWKLIGFVSFLIFIVQIPSSEEAGKIFSNFASMIIIKGLKILIRNSGESIFYFNFVKR